MPVLTRSICRSSLWTASRHNARKAFSSSSHRSAQEIRIVEVGPRDGLQNEKTSIPVQTKIELVERLAGTGLQTIEAGAFVSPKWVPQMANSSEILEHLLKQPAASAKPITYQWLLPNLKGLENYYKSHETAGGSPKTSSSTITADDGPAQNTSTMDPNAMPSTPPHSTSHLRGDDGPAQNTSSMNPNAMPSTPSGAAAGAAQHEVSIFMAATETFSKKNTNCSIAESLDRFRPLLASAKRNSTPVRAYVSVALGCPYEGPDVDPGRVTELVGELLEMGADEVSVADTTGMGTAPRTSELLRTLAAAGIQNKDLAFHFHDTYGQALVNTVVALEHGIRTFDSAVGGLGGCPFSPGATGNVATEDLIHCLHSLGADTGVDIQKMAQIGSWISQELGKANESRAGKATLAKM